MEITCLIPTRGERPEKLERAIASIDVAARIEVLENETGWLKAFNKAAAGIEKGAILLAGDDMEFHPGAITNALRVFEAYSPDTDRAVGFNQVNLDASACQAGFVLIGEQFRKRFPKDHFYCPDYKHYYADTEFWKYATSLGRFHYCEMAKVNHWHFSVTGVQDSTADVVRPFYQQDKATHKERQAKGWVWGRDPHLLRNAEESNQ